MDWGGLPVTDVYPKRIPDVFSARPVMLTGRYERPGRGVIRLRGRMSGYPMVREIVVNLPAVEPEHDVLATLWARARIDDLMGQDYLGIQRGAAHQDVREAVTQLGLDYRLMTQFTSFVAVEEMTVTTGGEPRRIEVPVEMPEGVSYEGVFGKDKAEVRMMPAMSQARTMAVTHGDGTIGRSPRIQTSVEAGSIPHRKDRQAGGPRLAGGHIHANH